MKQLTPFFVLSFWISSWFPTPPDRGAIFLAVVCGLGLIAAHLAPKAWKERGWPSKTIAILVFAVLVIGALLALMTWAEGTSANGAIMLFFVLGFVGYLLLLRSVFTTHRADRGYPGSGATLLFLLALWSWASAVGMYALRGADKPAENACILVSDPIAYDTKVSSLWDMRLPEIATPSTSRRGSYIWDYHAILIAKIDGRTEYYNWSKKWMRFELLDLQRNPYLPLACP